MIDLPPAVQTALGVLDRTRRTGVKPSDPAELRAIREAVDWLEAELIQHQRQANEQALLDELATLETT